MNIEKLMGDLSTNMKVKGAELNKIMAGTKTPQEAASKLTSAFPGASKGMLDAFDKLPDGSLEGGLGSLKLQSDQALSGLSDKFSGQLNEGLPKIEALMTEENINASFTKINNIMKDPETQKKIEEGISKIKNLEGLDTIKNKLTAASATAAEKFQSFAEGAEFDQLENLFKESAIDLNVEEAATKSQLALDKAFKEGGLQEIGGLNKEQLDGLTTQMGKFNSDFASGRFTQDIDGALGKFKMDPQMLESAGMLQKGLGDKFRSGALSASSIVNNPSSWVGGTKPSSKAAFLGNPKAQEMGFKTGLNNYYNQMKANGGIKAGDNARNQGAMLAISSKLGPAAAKQYRQGNYQAIGQELLNTADKLAKNGAYGVSILGARR